MRLFYTFILLQAAILIGGCGTDSKPSTPLETYKTYTKAVKQKDTTTMKLLLSKQTMEMHEQQAKTQGTTVNEVVKRESLVSEAQTEFYYRNEKIEGQIATLEVKNVSNNWEIVPFVFENGQWKIDKKGYADRISREIEAESKRADEEFNRGRIDPTTLPSPSIDGLPSNTTP